MHLGIAPLDASSETPVFEVEFKKLENVNLLVIDFFWKGPEEEEDIW